MLCVDLDSLCISSQVLLLLIRKLKHRVLNEKKESLQAVIALVVCYVVFIIIVGMDLDRRYVWARCVSFSSVCPCPCPSLPFFASDFSCSFQKIQLLHNVSFWGMMGYPTYMFWKDREGYENLFYGREGVSSSSAAALNVTAEQSQPDAPDTLGEGGLKY